MMAEFNMQHPKQPAKKLKVDDNTLPVSEAFGWQKTKKLGEQEHDLTSFESEPLKAAVSKPVSKAEVVQKGSFSNSITKNTMKRAK
jgi:hypothetical protein